MYAETTGTEDQEIDALDISFGNGLKAGKNDAFDEITELMEKWKNEERTTMSYKLFFTRILDELSETIKSWELKTIPISAKDEETSDKAEAAT